MADHIPHDHPTFVPGCFRCEMSRDESDAEYDAAKAWAEGREQGIREAVEALRVVAQDLGGAPTFARTLLAAADFIERHFKGGDDDS